MLSPRVVVRRRCNQGVAMQSLVYLPHARGIRTNLSSASLASLASGRTLIFIRSPPQARYILLSARVENCGPSIQTTHFPVCSLAPLPSASSVRRTRSSSQRTNLRAKGSPKPAWATTLVPSKKLAGRIPFVRSMIWVGREKSPGAISSRSEPTAENARIARTPRDFNAAILARDGTAEGEILCPMPCRARKATLVPEGREQIFMGELGNPQGWASRQRVR